MKKELYYLFGAFFLMAAVSVFVDVPNLARRAANAVFGAAEPEGGGKASAGQKEIVNGIYKTSFMFDKYTADRVMTYLPQYGINDAEAAERFAEQFGMPEAYDEKEISYVYENESGVLTVFKFLNLLRYEAEASGSGNERITSNEQAMQAALGFVADHGLPLGYAETVVNYDGQTYIVTFADKVGGILNYAFPTEVTVDNYGRVLAMDYYYYEYERLSSCVIKSMKQAYYSLPTDFEGETKIDLKRCTLVYRYENSILQPAYLFEGELAGGGTFRCFVNAAVYAP